MLTKVYFLLRGCLFEGFVGGLGYITRQDVMYHLLCYEGETISSWHKVMKQTEITFAKLERWMMRGNDWSEEVA